MLITIHGVMLDAHCNSWSDAFLVFTRGVKLYAHSFTWSENLCPLL